MTTQTLDFKKKPKDKDFDLQVEVDRDGNILSALAYCEVLDAWLDVSVHIQAHPIWKQMIEEKYQEIDWSEQRDDHESLQEYLEQKNETA